VLVCRFIDVLKLDIEGSEMNTLPPLLKEFMQRGSVPFRQLLLEVHHDDKNVDATFTLFDVSLKCHQK
jgi:hypothetical protein